METYVNKKRWNKYTQWNQWFENEVRNQYNLPYHNYNHIAKMIDILKKYYFLNSKFEYLNSELETDATFEDLITSAIIGHDLVNGDKNELKHPFSYSENETMLSTLEFQKYLDEYTAEDGIVYSDLEIELIKNAILSTADHSQTIKIDVIDKPSMLNYYLCLFDLQSAYFGDLQNAIEWEDGIFKEYQKHPIEKYREGRLNVLKQLRETLPHTNLEFIENQVRHKTYRIGYYAGSFNPFHLGHKNIVEKAEKIFDKVIIVRALNPEKVENQIYPFPLLPNQVIHHNGLITELFDSQGGVEKFLIRGLRNEYDLATEENYRKWVTEIAHKKDIKIEFCYFFCDPCFEHISSTMLRSLKSLDESHARDYIL